MGIDQVVSYIWVQQAFLTLYMTWFFEGDIFSAIVSGQVAYDWQDLWTFMGNGFANV